MVELKNKWIQLAGVGFLALLIAGGVWFLFAQQSSQEAPQQSDAARFQADYPKVNADNRFIYATGEQVLGLFENGTGIVFLGFPQCPWCQQLAPIVDEAAEAEGLEKVYYLNIRDARANNDETYQSLVGYLENYLDKDENGTPRIYVPDVTVLRDGQIVGRFEQEAAEGEVTPETYWTSERRERAVEQLRGMIRSTTTSDLE